MIETLRRAAIASLILGALCLGGALLTSVNLQRIGAAARISGNYAEYNAATEAIPRRFWHGMSFIFAGTFALGLDEHLRKLNGMKSAFVGPGQK